MRTIRVKGTGHASVAPDQVELKMMLQRQYYDYLKTMSEGNLAVETLKEDLSKVGINPKSIRTTSYNIATVYESVKDHNDNYKRVFSGFKYQHDLKLAFDFDGNRLNEVIESVAASESKPEFQIRFTTSEPEALTEAILKDAAENAKKKAGILCAGAGATLGQLQSIDYHWSEIDIYSETNYLYEPMPKMMAMASEIAPEDIEAGDTATFVWEIH